MKLYVFQVAPNPTKVRLYVAEKNAAGDELPVDEISVNIPEGEARTPEFLKKNPHGQLPVLELDDGRCFAESLAIIEYLEDRFPAPPLLGDSPDSRLAARERERYIDVGIMMPIGQAVHATRSPIGLPPNPPVADAANHRADKALDYIDEVMSDGRPFVMGDKPTVADCTLAAALQFGRYGRLSCVSGHEHVLAWDENYRSREAVQGIVII
ncbi:MAG: glutathione S-transferase family protein [Pseudomonadota bacterium]|nr:glutathione S-transferase family protein [Pseudomonadota bacterium]